jgi:predicted Zn finger-like uncharacterized protein
MNLATRCLSCGTVFRVGEEQLLASEGWVRCGRCNGVFNAAEVLFDIDTGAPMRVALPAAAVVDMTADIAADTAADIAQEAPEPPPPARPSATPPAAAAPARAYPDEPLLRAPSRLADDEPDEAIVITDHVPAPAAMAAPGTGIDQAHALLATTAAVAEPAAGTAAAAGTPAAAPAARAMPVQPAPAFLRQAERSALWRQPAMRAALGAGVLLLALGVLLQMALLWRDSLAAHLPGSAPALHALCRLAGCSVQPLRRIQQLSVDSSGLNRLEGSSLYRLQLVLRNRADTALMVPALDLTLTDPQGQLVARRVLPMAELGVPQVALQAGQELPIKVLLSTGERRIEGYTLELFYP